MLKKRIIPVQLLLNGRLVKTVGFDQYRDVGDPIASSKVYAAQYTDELVFLNISRGERKVQDLLSLIEKVSEVVFMPLAMGGGIRTGSDAELLIRTGADKVVVNSICYSKPRVITEIAERFGAQAVIAGIDVRRDGSGWALYSDCGRKREAVSLADHVRRCVEAGAGEILINSIDQDGTMQGYDIPLLKEVQRLAGVPVIACGGAGVFMHLKDAFIDAGVSACACGSLFNFGDNNPIRAKAFLSNYGIPFKKV